MNNIHIFQSWVYLHLKTAVLLLICACTVIIVALLAGLSMEYVFYTLLLCTFFTVCFDVFSFKEYYIKHQNLITAIECIENSIDKLDIGNDIVSKECVEIIYQLYERMTEISEQHKQRETEDKDYYTLWTHQIKTPIAAMKLLLDNGSADVTLLKSELFRIECYTEMALNYIRIESISEDMLIKEYNIRNIAAAALKKYFPLFSQKKLGLDFEDFRLTAVTDEKWLEFVIEQLISNSIKYTDNGSIHIYAKNNCLFISDSGIGISAEDLPRIFERGFTGYNGRMDKKSTGLGLYLCKKITKKLGHKLAIYSEIGKGTTAVIDFTQEKAM